MTFTAGVVATIGGAVVSDWIFPNGDHAAANADAYGPRVMVGLAGWLPSPRRRHALLRARPIEGHHAPRRLPHERLRGRAHRGEHPGDDRQLRQQGSGQDRLPSFLNGVRYQELLIGLGSKVIYDTVINKTGIELQGVRDRLRQTAT